MSAQDSRQLLRQGTPQVYELHIPERRRALRALLACPERIYVAWHKHALGVHALLDEYGHSHGHPPQESLWQVREYQRAHHYPDSHEAFYEEVTSA